MIYGLELCQSNLAIFAAIQSMQPWKMESAKGVLKYFRIHLHTGLIV